MESEKHLCSMPTRDIVERIILFIELLASRKDRHYRFYTYQSLMARRIIESIIENDGADITGLFARQAGKTDTIANTLGGCAIILPGLAREFSDDPRFMPFRRGFWGVVYAPVKEQAEISFSRMRAMMTSDEGLEILADPEINVQITTDRADTMIFSNGSQLAARSASPDTRIEGKTWHVVVAEEAQDLLRSKIEKEIVPMLATTNGTMARIGTAKASRGGFHLSIQQNLEKHRSGGKRDHFEFPYDMVVSERQRAYEEDGNVAHLLYAKFIAKELLRLGSDDTIEFKMNFRCLWQESRAIAIQPAVFTRAALEHLEASISMHGVQVAGLDVGKVTDSSVLTVMNVLTNQPIRNPFYTQDAELDKQFYYRKQIVDWYELGGAFEGEAGQYRRLVEYILRTNIQVLVVDSTGMGDPVYERIEAMIGGNITCVPYKFSTPSKSNLFKYYLQELNAGRITYPAGPHTKSRVEYKKFVGEHLDLDKEETAGYVVCRAPEGGHDDFPCSGALACHGERVLGELRMPDIEMNDSRMVASSSGDVEISGGGDSRGNRESRYRRGRR